MFGKSKKVRSCSECTKRGVCRPDGGRSRMPPDGEDYTSCLWYNCIHDELTGWGRISSNEAWDRERKRKESRY